MTVGGWSDDLRTGTRAGDAPRKTDSRPVGVAFCGCVCIRVVHVGKPSLSA